MLDRGLQSALKQSPRKILKPEGHRLVPAEEHEAPNTTPTQQHQATNINLTFLGNQVGDAEWGVGPVQRCKPPGTHVLDTQQVPEMTPSQMMKNKIKWLKDKPNLVLQVSPRGPGDGITRDIKQNTPNQMDSELLDQEMANLRSTIEILRHQVAQRNQAATTNQTAPGQQGTQVQDPNLYV